MGFALCRGALLRLSTAAGLFGYFLIVFMI